MYNSDMEKFMRKYSKLKKITRAKAIRIYCREMCCAGDLNSWKECEFYACPLWKFRTGKENTLKFNFIQKNKGKRGCF